MSETYYCPLIKERCKREECMLWHTDRHTHQSDCAFLAIADWIEACYKIFYQHRNDDLTKKTKRR